MELEYESDPAIPESRKILAPKMKDISPVNRKGTGVRSGQSPQDLKKG